jgi:hypothetical protein
MPESKIREQVIDLISRLFPEWIEMAESRITDFIKEYTREEGFPGRNAGEKVFASLMTRIYREEEGASYGSLAHKNMEIADYLVTVKDSGLSDEEIRWELLEKLGGLD